MGYETKNRVVAACLFTILSASYVDARPLVVAVVDSGNDMNYSKAPMCDIADIGYDLTNVKHGTNVVELIRQAAGDEGYCIIPFPVVSYNELIGMTRYESVLTALTYMKIDIVNLSVQGRKYSEIEQLAIKKLLDKGVAVIASAGNSHEELSKESCKVYPACSDPRVVVVGSYDASSNYGDRINIKSHTSIGCAGGYCLSGTSQATAIETGKYLKFLMEKSK
jgi:hypothetical protein